MGRDIGHVQGHRGIAGYGRNNAVADDHSALRPSNPPLIVGGHQPPGYIFVGTHHHGGPIWGSVDTVSLSMMDSPADAAATGHVEGQ